VALELGLAVGLGLKLDVAEPLIVADGVSLEVWE
jgi:hypothetical protein